MESPIWGKVNARVMVKVKVMPTERYHREQLVVLQHAGEVPDEVLARLVFGT